MRAVVTLLFIASASLALGVFVIPSNRTSADEPKLRPADSDSPLAKDWPDATKPGVIEVKQYPGYRSAVAKAKDVSMGADNILFFSLFNHISRSQIEMTTPVVNTYTPTMIETPNSTGEVSMEFVYRTPNMGKTGRGVGAVEVVDHPAQLYVCLGLQGVMNNDRMREGVTQLKTWLEEHKAEYVSDGSPRRLGYHGPMTPARERRWEVQLPIKRTGATEPSAAKPTDAPKTPVQP